VDRAVAIVAHGVAGGEALPAEAIHRSLGRLLGMEEADVKALSIGGEKVVNWKVAQMVLPMEAIVNEPPQDPPWTILSEAGPRPRVVIAGDFMTQSSFLGCVASASSAALAISEEMKNSD